MATGSSAKMNFIRRLPEDPKADLPKLGAKRASAAPIPSAVAIPSPHRENAIGTVGEPVRQIEDLDLGRPVPARKTVGHQKLLTAVRIDHVDPGGVAKIGARVKTDPHLHPVPSG